MTKTCSCCRESRDVSEFGIRRDQVRNPEARKSRCRRCDNAAYAAKRDANPEAIKRRNKKYYAEHRDEQRAAAAEWYRENREKWQTKMSARKAAGTEFIAEQKRKPCAICGVQYQDCVMSFDHLDPSQKRMSVANMKSMCRERILEEIAKTRVLCRNCHAISTWQKRHAGWDREAGTLFPKTYLEPAFVKRRARYTVLKNAPCTDCGKQYLAPAMSFDHIDPSQKEREVAKLAEKRYSRLIAEVAKTELVCLNCHALRTQSRLDAKKAA